MNKLLTLQNYLLILNLEKIEILVWNNKVLNQRKELKEINKIY